MNFNEFTKKSVELLRHRLGDTYTITVHKVLKNNNITLTGVMIEKESENISPTIYLDEAYSLYQTGVAINEIVEDIVGIYEKQSCYSDLDTKFLSNFELVKDRIYHKLINFEKNTILLEDIPYFRWNDLAVVFYLAVPDEIMGKASILIHNNHLKIWGVQDHEEMYHIACENMKCSRPERLESMYNFLGSLVENEKEETVLTQMYVLTNSESLYGASAMLYSEQIKELAKDMDSDLLILPSSVHEGATRFAA